MDVEESVEGQAERRNEAAVGIGSLVIAIGFWGLVIDLALKYSFYQESLVIETDDTLWFFCGIFFLGLLVVALGAYRGRSSRGRPGGRS